MASLEVYPAVGGKLSREYAIFESNVFWKSSERPQNVALILSSSHDYTDIKLLVTAVGRTPEETSSLNHSLKTAIEYKLLGLRDGLPGTITGAGRVQLRDVALVPGGVDPRSEGTVSRLQRLGLSTRPSPVVEVSMEFMVESQARAISRQVQEVLDTLFNEGQAGLDRMTADWVM